MCRGVAGVEAEGDDVFVEEGGSISTPVSVSILA